MEYMNIDVLESIVLAGMYSQILLSFPRNDSVPSLVMESVILVTVLLKQR